jgi:glutathione S-transferase
MIELYEVCGADPKLVFSPFCWRVRLAMAFKGLPFESRPITYSDKAAIAFSGQDLLPVLRDGQSIVHDSLSIACYLDRQYSRASLGLEGIAKHRATLIDRFAHQDLLIGLFRLLVLRILPLLSLEDACYFRSKHEGLLGSSLEAFADPSTGVQLVESALQPLKAQLQLTPFFDGDEPGAVDVLIGGFFLWAWVLRLEIWENHPEIARWVERLVARYEAVQGKIHRAPRTVR